jgi:ABC-type multidrug transport system ATPase subunit
MLSITIEELAKYYANRKVFSGISTRIQSPIYGIRGGNGTGKSTLLKCLVYLQPPSKGRVQWHDQRGIVDKDALKGRIGMAAPYISLYPQFSVQENLNFIRKLHALPPLGAADALEYDLQLKAFWSKNFSELSTGQQQRARLAAALAHNPEALVLDEPGSNLDRSGIEAVHSMVQARKNAGLLTIIASNDEEELSWCDQHLDVGAFTDAH